MVCFVLFQSEISYSKLTSCKCIACLKNRNCLKSSGVKFVWCVLSACVSIYIRLSYYYHADLLHVYDSLPLILLRNTGIPHLN